MTDQPGQSSPRASSLNWGPWQALSYGLLAAAVLFLVTSFLSAIRASAESERRAACLALEPEVRIGPAPPFELPDLKGNKKRLSALRGKVVLLNFWATWCPPCVEELPSLVSLASDPPGPGFVLLTVSEDETAKEVTSFLEKTGQQALPVLMDDKRRVTTSFGTSKFPETYLIDRDGNLRYRFINKRDWSSPTARACIESVMRE
jgi:thiol-disulfide isomerase/thioredoxin